MQVNIATNIDRKPPKKEAFLEEVFWRYWCRCELGRRSDAQKSNIDAQYRRLTNQQNHSKYRLENYLDLGARTTPGDASLVQLTILLGVIDGIENALFLLVKLRDRKSSF